MDVSVKVTTSGLGEAAQGLASLTSGTDKLSEAAKTAAEDQKRLNEAFARSKEVMAEKAKSQQELIDKDRELARSIQDKINAENAAKLSGESVAASMEKLALKYVSIGAAIHVVVGAYHQMREAEKESIETSLRLEASLKATGNTVGLTQKQLEGMATSLTKVSRFDDEDIKRGMSTLLVFGDVQQDVFSRASKLALDLAEKTGTSVPNAFRQMGIALQDGTESLGRMSMQIGSLSPAQKKMLEHFTEIGDVVGAQTLKLDILNEKIGGTAELMAGSPVTAGDRLARSWRELMEEMGRTADITRKSGAAMDWIGEKLDKLANNEGLKALIKQWSRTDIVNPTIKGWFGLKSAPESGDLSEEDRDDAEWAAQFIAQTAAQEKLLQRISSAKTGAKKKGPTLEQRFRDSETQMKETVKVLQLGAADASEAWDGFYAGWDEATKKSSALNTHVNANWIDEIENSSKAFNKRTEESEKVRLQMFEQMTKGIEAYDRQQENSNKDAEAGFKRLQHTIKGQMQEEIDGLRHIIFLTKDDRIAALKALGNEEKFAGEKGAEAQKLLQKHIRDTTTDSEDMTKKFAELFANSIPNSILRTVTSIRDGLSGAIYNFVSGTKSLGDSLTTFFKGVVQTILQELSKLAANALLQWLITGSVGGGGGLLSSFASGATSGAASSGASSLLTSAAGSAATSALTNSSAGTAVISSLGINLGASSTGLGTALTTGATDTIYATTASEVVGAAAMESIGAALPWIGAAMLAYAAFSGSPGGPKQQSIFWTSEGGGVHIGTNNLSDQSQVANALALSQFFTNKYPQDVLRSAEVENIILSENPNESTARMVAEMAVQTQNRLIDKGINYATGTDMIVSRPTVFMAGEVGSERVSVTPLSGRAGGGGSSMIFNGPVMFDEYTFRRFKRMLSA